MLLENLRIHCQAAHEALHVHPLLAPLQGDITLPQYKSIIAMFYAAYSETESHKPDSNFPDSPVLEWLKTDMATHGISPFHWQSAHTAYGSESEWVGYLYVKQGSCLGGQYISRQLQEKLGLEPGDGNVFFYGYGSHTGTMWRRFKTNLAASEQRLDPTETLAGARRAFDMIRVCADRILERTA